MADLGKVTGTITSLEMVGGTVVMLVFLLASEPIAAKLRASAAGE